MMDEGEGEDDEAVVSGGGEGGGVGMWSVEGLPPSTRIYQ